MAVTLNEIEYLADTLLQRVDKLLGERNNLRQELVRSSDGTLERNKAFIRAYQDGIIANSSANEKIAKLEYLLTLNN